MTEKVKVETVPDLIEVEEQLRELNRNLDRLIETLEAVVSRLLRLKG